MRKWIWIVGLATLVACNQQPNTPQVLKPGGWVEIDQKLDVNVVFVGFQEGRGENQINPRVFQSGLPTSYQTLNRYPNFYGLKEYTGNNFDFNYKIKFADTAFADKLFAYLSSIAVPKPLTTYQRSYNCQKNLANPNDPSTDLPCPAAATNTALQIPDTPSSNHWIDAPSVEQWLVQNAPSIGVDPTKYTVFFLNWYGRPDFRFHVYTKTDDPDPDTGYNFGQERASRKMIAWGGTPANPPGSVGRVWFVDLSAGPERWSDNWDITRADVDGDQVTDYRIPPFWEYGSLKPAYRPFNNLSGDLAKITRYVAVNLLFTPSPLYRVQITPPLMPSHIQVTVSVYQGDPTVDGSSFIQSGLMNTRWNALQPVNRFSTKISPIPYTAAAKQAYDCVATQNPCDPGSQISQAGGDLFLYNFAQLPGVLSANQTPGTDYQVPVFAYHEPNPDPNVPEPFLGLADDDWTTGTQSMVYAIDSQADRALGYGFTTTLIHEVGHHTALSHPHDGYDPGEDVDYGAGGPFYYAQLGDESHSIMSYIDLSSEFGQFNRDSMNRYLVAAYLNQANAILKVAADSGQSNSILAQVLNADASARRALVSYQAMNYDAAAQQAKAAYSAVVAAVQGAGVSIPKFVWYEGFTPFSTAASTVMRNILHSQGLRKQGVVGQSLSGTRILHYFPIDDTRWAERRNLP